MLVFHELVYDGYVLTGAASPFCTGPHLMPLLGAVDVLHVSGYAVQVTGTSPTLTIAVEVSNDRLFWWPQNFLSPVINAVPLSVGTETLFQGVDANPAATRFAYARLNIVIGGTNARASVRIWATGRDQSRRSVGIASAATGKSAMGLPRPMPKIANGRSMHGPKA